MLQFTRLSVFITFTVLICIASADTRNKREFGDLPFIASERTCLSEGGICVHESKCPANKINLEVECAEQKALGAVCCHSAHPPDETRCEALAGECKTVCADTLKVAQATNCGEGEVCCTLV